MKGFKNIKGQYISNIIDYSLDLIKSDPNIRIYIGTDSQNMANFTSISTVIAYRKSFGRGVHFIYRKEQIKPKIKDITTRLFKEAEYTTDVAKFIMDNSVIKITAIEFDVNKNPTSKSNKAVAALTGWGTGMGLKVFIKPDELVAVKAANETCR